MCAQMHVGACGRRCQIPRAGGTLVNHPSNSSPLQEQQTVLTTEPSVYPRCVFKCYLLQTIRIAIHPLIIISNRLHAFLGVR